jgi:hypothetical protein
VSKTAKCPELTVSQIVKPKQDPTYQFKLSEIVLLINTLRSFNLTCVLTLPTEGAVWRTVDEQISAHLQSHNISVKSSCFDYFSTDMYLIHPRRGPMTNPRRFSESNLTPDTFTAEKLKEIAQLLSNPEEGAQHLLLFFGTPCRCLSLDQILTHFYLAPRHRNLWAPLPEGSIDHLCFPWRVWKDLQQIAPTEKNKGGDCTMDCPRQTQVGFEYHRFFFVVIICCQG